MIAHLVTVFIVAVAICVLLCVVVSRVGEKAGTLILVAVFVGLPAAAIWSTASDWETADEARARQGITRTVGQADAEVAAEYRAKAEAAHRRICARDPNSVNIFTGQGC